MFDSHGNKPIDNGIITIHAKSMLNQLYKISGFRITSDDIARLLRKAGLLRGLGRNGDIDMDASDWNSIYDTYKRLMPPEGLCV